MANKNKRRLRIAVRAAGKSGNAEFSTEVPMGGYHNYDKGSFQTLRTPTAVRSKDGVVSSNPARNTQMRELQNHNENGYGQSVTVHDSINRNQFVTHKGHGYLVKDERDNNQYRQPKGAK